MFLGLTLIEWLVLAFACMAGYLAIKQMLFCFYDLTRPDPKLIKSDEIDHL